MSFYFTRDQMLDRASTWLKGQYPQDDAYKAFDGSVDHPHTTKERDDYRRKLGLLTDFIIEHYSDQPNQTK